MKAKYVFDHEAYHATLRSLAENRYKVHSFQRGGGFGSVCKRLIRFIIPILREHVLPHVQSIAASVAADVIHNNSSIKDAVIKQTKQLASKLRGGTVQNLVQAGGGITRRIKKSKLQPLLGKRKKTNKVVKSKVKRTKFDYLS